jgi:hypothetical protein
MKKRPRYRILSALTPLFERVLCKIIGLFIKNFLTIRIKHRRIFVYNEPPPFSINQRVVVNFGIAAFIGKKREFL